MREPRHLIIVVSLLLTVVGAWTIPVHAAPCVPGTLTDYFALGSGGCTVGSNSFTDFVELPLPFGATEIPASEIQVVPVEDPLRVGLDFVRDTTAGPGEFLDIRFGYTVTGKPVSGASLALFGSSVVFPGASTAVTDLCLGSAFAFDLCLGTPVSLVVADIGVDAQLVDATAFAPVTGLGVITDIGVDGADGTASLTRISNRFVVPEPPGALLLVVTGLSLVGFIRRNAR